MKRAAAAMRRCNPVRVWGSDRPGATLAQRDSDRKVTASPDLMALTGRPVAAYSRLPRPPERASHRIMWRRIASPTASEVISSVRKTCSTGCVGRAHRRVHHGGAHDTEEVAAETRRAGPDHHRGRPPLPTALSRPRRTQRRSRINAALGISRCSTWPPSRSHTSGVPAVGRGSVGIGAPGCRPRRNAATIRAHAGPSTVIVMDTFRPQHEPTRQRSPGVRICRRPSVTVRHGACESPRERASDERMLSVIGQVRRRAVPVPNHREGSFYAVLSDALAGRWNTFRSALRRRLGRHLRPSSSRLCSRGERPLWTVRYARRAPRRPDVRRACRAGSGQWPAGRPHLAPYPDLVVPAGGVESSSGHRGSVIGGRLRSAKQCLRGGSGPVGSVCAR